VEVGAIQNGYVEKVLEKTGLAEMRVDGSRRTATAGGALVRPPIRLFLARCYVTTSIPHFVSFEVRTIDPL
jgi:hypothetical protein